MANSGVEELAELLQLLEQELMYPPHRKTEDALCTFSLAVIEGLLL